ncbi:MAG: hypothetical protein PUJ11_03245 [Eubacteriaceae bacterium]|nr:hypothetical protein [Eubacteriaceae bacterium]
MCNESLVYLNKVYTDIQASSCPLLTCITATSENFNQQLTFIDPAEDCRRCCSCPSELEGELTFAVESTEVFVSDFNLCKPEHLHPCNVTVDGIPVDDLEFFNDRFSASTNALMTQISDCECMRRNKSTAGYFLITGISDWKAKLTIVLRGSVFGCGSCRRFKLVMTSKECESVPISGNSTFASPRICLPCTTNGIAPIISFSFGATAALLNPVITSEPTCGRPCNVSVTGSLITEPTVNVQVTRATLFRTDAESINIPCDDMARCQDAPGTCNPCERDDDSRAIRIHERCCCANIDRHGEEDEEQDDDICCEDREYQRNHCRDNRDICCQFNGCNGCRF